MAFNIKTIIAFAIAFACSLTIVKVDAGEISPILTTEEAEISAEVLARSFTNSVALHPSQEILSAEILARSFSYSEAQHVPSISIEYMDFLVSAISNQAFSYLRE